MLQNDSADLISQLIRLSGSTTFFLESLKKDRLKVIIESQTETDLPGHPVITRVVKLFFYSPDNPVLYCISNLNKDRLTSLEYESLMEERLPIGIVFHHFNDASTIEKRNVRISRELNPHLARLLNVQSPSIVNKQYDYWVDGRHIGEISEYFNEESIIRL